MAIDINILLDATVDIEKQIRTNFGVDQPERSLKSLEQIAERLYRASQNIEDILVQSSGSYIEHMKKAGLL